MIGQIQRIFSYPQVVLLKICYNKIMFNLRNMETASDKSFYFGDKETDGSWRMRIENGDLHIEKRQDGNWEIKTIIPS